MKKMKRVVVIVLDGCGAGWQHDAAQYGDEGANTLKHVLEQAKPVLPNLTDLGLMKIMGMQPADADDPIGCYGTMVEQSAGKDTTTGHWEIAGLTLHKPFPTYPNGFPPEVIEEFERETGMGTIGNKVASGTEIIKELGAEHLRTGKLIIYTSADSVFQIAAHEAVLPPMELWHVCRTARRLLKGPHNVGRVIARPFVGEVGAFVRTANRRDFSVDPTGRTMLDVAKDERHPFYVETFASTVKVLGTRFDVEVDETEQAFAVTLLRGRVVAQDKRSRGTVDLQPDERLALKDGRLTKTRVTNPSAVDCWTEGLIDVSDIPFDALMRKFENAFNVKILLDRDEMPTISYTRGKIRISDGIDHALEVLQVAADFVYERDFDKNTIIIK